MWKWLKKGWNNWTCIEYKKGEEWTSQEYEKYRTVQYKKRKAKLSKITSPAMMAIFEVIDECTDDTYPVDVILCE